MTQPPTLSLPARQEKLHRSTVLRPGDGVPGCFRSFEIPPTPIPFFHMTDLKSPPLARRFLRRSAFLLSFIFLLQPPPPPCLGGRKPLSRGKIYRFPPFSSPRREGEARFPVSRVSQPTKNVSFFSPGYQKLFNGAKEFTQFPTGGTGGREVRRGGGWRYFFSLSKLGSSGESAGPLAVQKA